MLLANVLVGSLLAWALPAESAPPVGLLLREQRTFDAAVRHVEAEIRVQRGEAPEFLPLMGLRAGLTRALQLTKGTAAQDIVELTPDNPPGEPWRLVIHRGKTLALDGEPTSSVTYDEVGKNTAEPELRLLFLALASKHLEKTLRKTGTRFERKLLTLDRVDGRLVWAIGNDEAVIWLDRELHRLARLELGPGVLDEHGWAVKLTYHDIGPGKGWFPDRMQVERDGERVLTVHVVSAQLRR